jgi:predicted RecB family endonuclease
VGKEEKSEAELEEMIAQRIVVGGVYVSVRRDPLLGWRPMVITAPKHATYAQQLADEVATELRKKFVLKD